MKKPEQEGIIKFALQYEQGPAPAWADIADLNAWRQVLYRLGLIGQDPERYEGFGFGNVSRRMGVFSGAAEQRRFVISGTQTGMLETLGPDDYVLVNRCCPQTNEISATGPVKPSSEALTHGALYAADNQLRAVLHAHSPEIWQAAMTLGLPVTNHRVAYGTPEMAEEMQRLYADPSVRDAGIIVMGGHPDGVVSFGPGLDVAGQIMVKVLARSMALAR